MEMEEERIGLVLVRASELRSKIANCMHKSTNPLPSQLEASQNNGDSSSSAQNADEADEDTDALLNICYSFDSLERQLSSLQSLRQQQQYEREAVIAEIERNRKMLLMKLSEYKGEHSDVIQEAEAFASMKVEDDNELLLSPYQTHPTNSLGLDKGYLSSVPYSRKLAPNGLDVGSESKKSQTQSKSNMLWGGFRFLVHYTTKTMLTLVGVISLLSLAGFEPKLQKKGAKLNVLSLFQQPNASDGAVGVRCPPGKTAVMEDGEIRCIVKERVEIPFDSVADNPDVHYGCG